MTRGNMLHFINRIDENNCGDRVASPLGYYFDFFRKYKIKRHDMRFIDFDQISEGDVVIIGGGGMLNYAEFTNRALNRVLDIGAKVIAWAPGFNTHFEYSGVFETQIAFEKFEEIVVRDYENKYGIEYLPDVTCKIPELQRNYKVCRRIGIARHKDYPISLSNYDTITNDSSVEEIIRFIGESEVIVSNSFHMTYWALLMGKKTICTNAFSDKFFSYKYKPEYLDTELVNLEKCINRAKKYSILNECIQANDSFFAKVKKIIENTLPVISEEYDIYNFCTIEVLFRQKVRELQLNVGDLLISQLFVDTGHGFSEDCKVIAINNVYGDDVHVVRYELSQYADIRTLRFDPIEARNCEVEIISARTDKGNVKLAPVAAISIDGKERFLTTDPQYYISTDNIDYLEIEFRLKLLDSYEAEQNIYSYIGLRDENDRKSNYTIRQLESQIEEQNEQIRKMECHNKKIQNQLWRIAWKQRKEHRNFYKIRK